MSNRVIKDLIWTSPRLASYSIRTQLHFPRLLLLQDDWGCFNADPDVIRGLAYPKMRITTTEIESILQEFEERGLLFRWRDGLHEWGYWMKSQEHTYARGPEV